MGGPGSGRHGGWGRSTTTDLLGLDVRAIHRTQKLTPRTVFRWAWWRKDDPKRYRIAALEGRVGVGVVTVAYRLTQAGNAYEREELIHLNWTRCFGGVRPWFLCPGDRCRRRVAILFLGVAGFRCRQCNRLAFDSDREGALDRLARRGNKIRDRLRWEPGILNGSGERPKGMHRRTFERLWREHDAIADRLSRYEVALLASGR